MNTKIRRIISTILALNLIFSINLFAAAENEDSWKNKIDEKIYEKITDKDTKVPVYIWLTDVEHEEVIAETEETLGYGEEDLAVIDEDFSDELAISVSNLSETNDESVSDELAKYLKKTEKKRKAEKEKTDKYIEKKREKYRDKYNEKSKDFLEKAKIEDTDIIFRSQYAPMIIAELTEKQIKKVAKSDEVCEINYHEKLQWETQMTLSELKEITGVDIIHDIGLTGAGVKVAVHDDYCFYDKYGEFTPYEERFHVLIENNDTSKEHSITVTRILCGNNGIAPKAECYLICSSVAGNNEYYQGIETLISNGVSIINYSKGVDREDNYYTNREKWIDHISTVHNVNFVVSAGNDTVKVCDPAMAYNAITVGAFDNNSTILTSDDAYCTYSNYSNGGGCEKPDILAQGNVLGVKGTSYSAPYVSGVIALMLELRPSLAAYPQAVKAILLASCHHKASSSPTETMAQGITEKQGAGVVDVYRAISIAGRGNYGVRSIAGGTTNTDVRFNVPWLYGATGINVSIAWLRNNTISGSHLVESNLNAGNPTNLNLTVLNGGTTVGTSTKSNSSTEMVYITSPVADTTYTARINRADSYSETVKVAYAWSFNEEQFQYTGDFEGVYFIKNKQSGNYLNYSSSTGYTQKAFSNSNYQKWIVWKKSNGYYTINSFVGDTGCLDIDSVVSGKYFSIGLDSSNTADVSVQMNNDGSITINSITGGSQYLLSVLNNSTSANAQIVWKKRDSAADMEASQNWYLEPVCYQVGDVDMDGQIAAADSRTVLNYSSGAESYGNFANIKKYLSDANSDGLITAADSRLILRFASGLE